MPSESVEIIIDADDKATPKIDAVVQNVDDKVKRIKEVGERAKASTEIIVSVASAAGGGQVASALGPLSALIEKIGAVSEVSKAGGAGALAFKAGIVGVAAVAGYKIGEFIGNWVYETDKWNKSLDKANAALMKSAMVASEIVGSKISVERETIGQIEDKQQRDLEYRATYNKLSKEAEELARSIAEVEKRQAKENETTYNKSFGLSERKKASDEAELAGMKAELEAIEKEQSAIGELIRLDKQRLETLKEANALKKRSDDFIKGLQAEIDTLSAVNDAERIRIEVNKQFADIDVATRDRIEALMSEKMELENIAQAEKAAEQEAKRRADEAERNQQRINDLRQSELNKLEEQRILLTQGKEAAKSFALQKQGLSEIDANRIAREQAALDKANAKAPGNVQATESRLMVRGSTTDLNEKQLRAQERTAKAVEELNRKTKQGGGNTLTIEEVGP